MKLLKWSPFPSNKDIQGCTLPTEGLRRRTDLEKCSITVSSTHFGRRLRKTMTMPTSTMTSDLQDHFRESLTSQYLIHEGFFARLFSVFLYVFTVTGPNLVCKAKAIMSRNAELRSRGTQKAPR